MSLIMISCRHASELMSQKLDRPLKLGEKLRLNLHLMICKSCPETMHQFAILRQAGEKYVTHHQNESAGEIKLSTDAKTRILSALQEDQTLSNNNEDS